MSHIFAEYGFSKVDTRDIFSGFLFLKVNIYPANTEKPCVGRRLSVSGNTGWRYGPISFFVFFTLLSELRFLAQHALREDVSEPQFAPVKTLAVIVRCIVANGKTQALSIIEVNIAVKDLLHSISCAALLQPEINVEFFFYPAIQCLVDRIVGLFSCP